MKTPKNKLLKSLMTAGAILAALIIYAYGFQVTQVNLKEVQSPRRQESLTRVLRALARPDLIEFEQKEVNVSVPIYTPCPTGGAPATEPDKSGPYLVVTPACADPKSEVTVEGFNFTPNSSGPINFIPTSEVKLKRGEMTTDENGYFKVTITLPDRSDTAVQSIATVTRQRVGGPHFTQTAKDTWDKILETVFLALLATTFGVIFSIPISFLAARNLMRDVTTTVSGLALSLLAWPLGIWGGIVATHWIQSILTPLSSKTLLDLLLLAVILVGSYFLVRFAIPPDEERKPARWLSVVRTLAIILAAVALVVGLYLFAYLAMAIGNALLPKLGAFSFLASFVGSIGEILNVLIAAIVALCVGAVVSNLVGKVGKRVLPRLSGTLGFIVNIILAALAGAVLFVLVMALINWFYQFANPAIYTTWPAILGALTGIILAIRARKVDVVPVGITIYYITRTILNALRSIEALIMAIVFVVWVGIGPFAGVLALSLHTIAALAKLYSEQVESISAGPLEAIRATGANRLQTILYGVVPQIVPPYISFTMYRWDINVRMSTIIGFAGGGGIGLLLSQNINLLNYRAASAQMLAIAIVVAMMDYLSSYLREKVV